MDTVSQVMCEITKILDKLRVRYSVEKLVRPNNYIAYEIKLNIPDFELARKSSAVAEIYEDFLEHLAFIIIEELGRRYPIRASPEVDACFKAYDVLRDKYVDDHVVSICIGDQAAAKGETLVPGPIIRIEPYA